MEEKTRAERPLSFLEYRVRKTIDQSNGITGRREVLQTVFATETATGVQKAKRAIPTRTALLSLTNSFRKDLRENKAPARMKMFVRCQPHCLPVPHSQLSSAQL
jgi:hypothetical protein